MLLQHIFPYLSASQKNDISKDVFKLILELLPKSVLSKQRLEHGVDNPIVHPLIKEISYVLAFLLPHLRDSNILEQLHSQNLWQTLEPQLEAQIKKPGERSPEWLLVSLTNTFSYIQTTPLTPYYETLFIEFIRSIVTYDSEYKNWRFRPLGLETVGAYIISKKGANELSAEKTEFFDWLVSLCARIDVKSGTAQNSFSIEEFCAYSYAIANLVEHTSAYDKNITQILSLFPNSIGKLVSTIETTAICYSRLNLLALLSLHRNRTRFQLGLEVSSPLFNNAYLLLVRIMKTKFNELIANPYILLTVMESFCEYVESDTIPWHKIVLQNRDDEGLPHVQIIDCLRSYRVPSDIKIKIALFYKKLFIQATVGFFLSTPQASKNAFLMPQKKEVINLKVAIATATMEGEKLKNEGLKKKVESLQTAIDKYEKTIIAQQKIQ